VLYCLLTRRSRSHTPSRQTAWWTRWFRPTVEHKFVRDSCIVSDIQATKPRDLYCTQRDSHHCGDIEGAWPGWRPRDERACIEVAPLSHQYDVRDINAVGFKSTRNVVFLKLQNQVHAQRVRPLCVCLVPFLPARFLRWRRSCCGSCCSTTTLALYCAVAWPQAKLRTRDVARRGGLARGRGELQGGVARRSSLAFEVAC
jgi:hypothetical protein